MGSSRIKTPPMGPLTVFEVAKTEESVQEKKVACLRRSFSVEHDPRLYCQSYFAVQERKIHSEVDLEKPLPFLPEPGQKPPRVQVNVESLSNKVLLEIQRIYVRIGQCHNEKERSLQERELGLLGKGSFGDVYAVIDPVTKDPLACKVAKKGSLGVFSPDNGEAVAFHVKDHAYILTPKFLGISAKVTRKANLMQWMLKDKTDFQEGMDPDIMCSAHIKIVVMPKARSSLTSCITLSILDSFRLYTELVSAVKYMHAKYVFHRDIKPDNILVAVKSGSFMLGDFGTAIRVNDDNFGALSVQGTGVYMAPEIWEPTFSQQEYSDTPNSAKTESKKRKDVFLEERRCLLAANDWWQLAVTLVESRLNRQTDGNLDKFIQPPSGTLPENLTIQQLLDIIKALRKESDPQKNAHRKRAHNALGLRDTETAEKKELQQVSDTLKVFFDRATTGNYRERALVLKQSVEEG